MIHYNVILLLFLFRFVANAQGLQWDNFLVLTMNRRGVTRIYLAQANITPGLTRFINNPDSIGIRLCYMLTKKT